MLIIAMGIMFLAGARTIAIHNVVCPYVHFWQRCWVFFEPHRMKRVTIYESMGLTLKIRAIN